MRTVGDQPGLWEAILPPELLVLPTELGRVDGLLDDPVFFAPFVPFFDPRIGRPSIPMETYLRLMFLKFRYRLGYESLCRKVTDSITWRLCRIPLDGRVPHPTTLMKLTTRCGSAAVDGLNEALLAKAAEAKLLRTTRVRADTTVVPANVAYPTDSGLLTKAIRRIAGSARRIQAAGGVNLLTKVPKSAQAQVATQVRTVFDQGDAEAVTAQYDRVVNGLERYPEAAEHLDAAREELLAFTAYPREIWRQIWSNNPQVIWSPWRRVLYVVHEGVSVRDLRRGGGYLPPSITWIFRRSDACSAGRLARLAS